MPKLFSMLIKKSVGLYINILSYLYPKKAARVAYKFFSEPRDGRLLQGQLPKILQEADAEMITHNDLIFQMYTWQGNHNKVLLVHGWESNTSRWEELIKYLKKSGSTIMAIDGPAHGLTEGTEFNIPRYAQFIDIIVQRFSPQMLIGHSLGGATAMYYQSHYKDNSIQKTVILGAPCDLDTILKNYRGMLSLNSRVSKLMQKHFLNHFKIKTREFSGSLFASKIKAKALVAHDVDDEVVAFKEGQKIAKAWPSAEFIVTRGLGHSMHDDKLYRRIYNFLFAKEAAV